MQSTHFIFNTSRFINLLKREIILSVKPFLYVSAAILGSYFVGILFSLLGPHTNNPFNTENLTISLGFLMIIWASISFHEIASSSGRQFYLSLPASHLEKISSKWLSISVLIPLLYTLSYTVFAYLTYYSMQLFGVNWTSAPRFDFGVIFKMISIYISVQSLFYLGSIVWPKHSIFKTGLSIFIVSMVLAMITLLFMRIVFFDYFQGASFKIDNHNSTFQFDTTFNSPIIRKIAVTVASLFTMIVAYFKLKEKEL